ncbi:UV excision repair RAD23-like protein, putative [Bodo saltans]|uniref:UV excision repair protein RAD23 n=1 Tax=Bodo saltans TaxID=75058 RepID=A0A0S4KFK0_BODSA|nr:UV excision repair RAD23-like protein, putative [Bodo saltans]|eukprot:CUI14424.1 UV excision repair RAD23-like protein, putative [Bodo saltans]
MLITLRTLTGAATNSEVEPTDTPKVLKDQLISQEGYDAASLKLCYKGKVLEDSKTLAELGFVGGEVVIIAGRKSAVKPVVASAPAPAQPAPQATAEAPVAQAPVPAAQPASAEPSPAPAEPVAVSVQAPAPVVAPPTTSALHGVDSSLVDGIVAMGFEDRNQVALALRAAYMNADRAVEYLCTGIPPAALAQIQQQLQQQQAPPQQQPRAQAQSQPRAAAPSALRQALSAIPQFEQIRSVVRQNPQSLQTVMAQLRERHPEVFALVQANPQEFLGLMNEPADMDGQGTTGNVAGPDGARQFAITEADREPIQRLVTLGGGMWDERAASIVYVVCNRSEDLAANVLFDNGGLPAELAAAVMEGGLAPGDGDFDAADFEEDDEEGQQ